MAWNISQEPCNKHTATRSSKSWQSAKNGGSNCDSPVSCACCLKPHLLFQILFKCLIGWPWLNLRKWKLWRRHREMYQKSLEMPTYSTLWYARMAWFNVVYLATALNTDTYFKVLFQSTSWWRFSKYAGRLIMDQLWSNVLATRTAPDWGRHIGRPHLYTAPW